MNKEEIFAITRPHENLLKLYLIHSLLAFPLFIFIFPPLLIRYYTLRYKLDEEGITMSWGLLFRKKVQLTYARIQDIHLSSGIIQRWLGLADIQIQTASGNAAAEMVIEGLKNYEEIRDFVYGKMRGLRSPEVYSQQKLQIVPPETGEKLNEFFREATTLLREIIKEMRSVRELLQKSSESVTKE